MERGNIRHALFDFDGTISLIREGWQQVMIPLMVEILKETPEGKHEPEEQLNAIVTEFVTRLTGKQTIYQMIQLCEEIKKRGGEPLHPLEYKRIYHDRLMARIRARIEGLKRGTIPPEEMRLPGSLEMLKALRERDVTLYLASGTDIGYVLEEAKLIEIADCFNGGIYGALDEWWKFSKEKLIQHIIREHNLHGSEFAGFGDGFVEIENTKAVNGIAIGVASDEVRRKGINEWKRQRLIQAGADIIIPEFREHDKLLAYLFDE
ncbi:MAG TPA: HAD family hydrolase [Armatimonadetes bacterium]|nr:HAD family hydrolase [Armatimonadota bacterium]